MTGMAQWIMFEHDKCEKCDHPKVCLITPGEKELQVIVSCDCDAAVFDQRWKAAKESDQLIVVVDMTVNDMLRMIAETLRDNQ